MSEYQRFILFLFQHIRLKKKKLNTGNSTLKQEKQTNWTIFIIVKFFDEIGHFTFQIETIP